MAGLRIAPVVIARYGLTYDPRAGRRDSERHCTSNIHANGGLGIAQAAATLC